MTRYKLVPVMLFALLLQAAGAWSRQASPVAAEKTLSGKTGKATILWDTYGVPHVYAKNLQEMYYSFGWAQMHNHADLLLRLYAQARGRAAAYLGENYLAEDKLVQLYDVPELARQHRSRQHKEMNNYLEAFVAGMNAYATAHPEAIGAPYKPILPITANDVMGHKIRVLYLKFLARGELGAVTASLNQGSNAWAIGPSKSASHHAMLLANPHLPWKDLYLFFEAHLNAPGFHTYGATLIGIPVLAIAFNEHLGWSHTVNTIDAADRYALTLQDQGYLLDGRTVPFVEKKITLQVKQADGSLKAVPHVLRYTQHGPVLEKGKKAFAVRIAGMDSPDLLYQWHRMGMATNWKQFEAALKLMQLPMFNVMYADDAGNISYTFAGMVPKRDTGDWSFWHQTVDGTRSSYIWHKIHAYAAMPKLLNPRSGFLQNSNDPPWSCTYPAVLQSGDYPAYMSPLEVGLRPQRGIRMLLADSLITFDQLIADKHDTHMEATDRLLDELLAAAQAHPDATVQQAAAILKAWDRTAGAESRGGVLFVTWFDQLKGKGYRQAWNVATPVGTPTGLKDPAQAVELLKTAAIAVAQDYGKADVAWGEVYRLRGRNGEDYPGNGSEDRYGVFRVIEYTRGADKKKVADAGDSYVAVLEFGKQVKARVSLSYGNATQPGSRHAWDQLPLISRQELRTPWLQQEEVLQHLEEKEELQIKQIK
ncbi:acylase [Chitinophaga nivalis]|uniref:Acylase n=1 Tax=Chitinophaga nivalis TaxID=2991709 RepID=A0ABT3IK11_9BACT|nr:acylase [Chitinophaga nivalis]MCW3466007.1 acylase [Chitinophaga nivalis]MCW3484302.1 acylase [Chitinophaga nivalis]